MSKPNKVTKSSAVKTSAKASSSSIKAQEAKKKIVFRPILDNPYTQSNVWPFIEPQLGVDIIDLLENILKTNKDSKEIYHGFNSTVGTLEKQAAYNRGKTNDPIPSQIKYVFVCKFDMTTPILTSMFPVLCMTSSKNDQNMVKLIQLPRGSIERLSKALGIDNSGIIGITENLTQARPLYDLINENVKNVEVPWLNGIFNKEVPFEVPNIKQIQTTLGDKKSTKKNV
ncbi:Ribonucleases P/MRP protein subunit POP3 [Candida tropicalis]